MPEVREGWWRKMISVLSCVLLEERKLSVRCVFVSFCVMSTWHDLIPRMDVATRAALIAVGLANVRYLVHDQDYENDLKLDLQFQDQLDSWRPARQQRVGNKSALEQAPSTALALHKHTKT